MSESRRSIGSDLKKVDGRGVAPSDYEDVPELADDVFDTADLYDGETLVRRGRGRPRSAAAKQQVSLRLDAEVLSALRASGPGWQTRVNEMLRGLLLGAGGTAKRL